jgi:tRNA pseudouridine38-40 synthase
LCWDGGAYVGWQRQPNGPSIQAAVEAALRQLLGGESVTVRATGRTDAGVHAAIQIAGFRCQTARTPTALKRGLNACLPRDIACLGVAAAPLDFDPRRWTLGKRYRYRLLVREPRCPFREGFVWHLADSLDVPAIRLAAGELEGRHDFGAFRAAGCGAAHAVRTIERVDVARSDDEVHIDFVGNGFLRHQVRIMVGTLVEVGRGRRTGQQVAAALAARDRAQAGPTAPAAGLWLQEVLMGDGPRTGPPR